MSWCIHGCNSSGYTPAAGFLFRRLPALPVLENLTSIDFSFAERILSLPVVVLALSCHEGRKCEFSLLLCFRKVSSGLQHVCESSQLEMPFLENTDDGCERLKKVETGVRNIYSSHFMIMSH